MDFDDEYVFRHSKDEFSGVVGNIIHVPAGSELMKLCYDEAISAIDEENKDWMAPIRILNKHIRNLDLERYTRKFSNSDSWPEVSRLLTPGHKPENQWKAIHWMNEEFRRIGLPKDKYVKGSFLGTMFEQFGLGTPVKSGMEKWSYSFRSSLIYYTLLNLTKEQVVDALSSRRNFRQKLYYLGYNIYYFISDLYFVHTKPYFDIGKYVRTFLSLFIGKRRAGLISPKTEVLIDQSQHQKLVKLGYVTLPVLDEDIISQLKEFYLKLSSPFEKGFHPTMMWNDPQVKVSVSETICRLLENYVNQHMQGHRLLYGNFMVKQPGGESAMKLHQDWAYVDEREQDSYAIWFPLDDLTKDNGALYMVPGSHKIKNTVRGPGVFCPFFDHNELITSSYGIPLYLKKGQPVLWHHRMLHYSPANLSDQPRIAVTAILVPVGQEVIHYYKPENTDEVEKYSVQDGFYFNYEIGKRPVKYVTLLNKFTYTFPTVPLGELQGVLEE